MDLVDLCTSLSPPIDANTLDTLETLLQASRESSIHSTVAPILLTFLTTHQRLLSKDPTFSTSGGPFFSQLLKHLLYSSKDLPKASHLLDLILHTSIHVDLDFFIFYLRYCFQHDLHDEAIQLHLKLQEKRPEILEQHNPFVPMLVELYAKLGKAAEVKRIWERLRVKDTECWNAMVMAYARGNCVGKAEELILQLSDKRRISMETWRLVIKTRFAQPGNWRQGLKLFEEMERSGMKADGFCWSIIVGGLFRNNLSALGQDYLTRMRKSGADLNAMDWTYLLECLFRCHSNHLILKLIEEMKDNKIPSDTVSWTFLVQEYLNHGKIEKAIYCFEIAKKIVVPDTRFWEALLKGLFKNNQYAKGVAYFQKMKQSDVKPEITTWVMLIKAHLQNNQYMKVFEDISNMKAQGLTPDSNFWNPILSYIFELRKPDLAMIFLQLMNEEGCQFDGSNWHVIIQGFFTFDSGKAIQMFDSLPLCRVVVSVNTWNMVIDELRKLGNLELAQKYARQMEQNGMHLSAKVQEQLVKLASQHNAARPKSEEL